jgi:hypothetical protein
MAYEQAALLGLLVLPDGGSPQAQQAALAVLEEEQGAGAPGATLQALRQRLRAFAQGVRLEGAVGRDAAVAAAAVSGAGGAAHEEAVRGVLLTLRLVQALCASQQLGMQRLMLSGHAPAATAAAPPASAPAAPATAADEAPASTAKPEGAGMLLMADGDANRAVHEGGVLGECGVLGEAARHLVAFAAWPQPGLLPLARQASGLPLRTPSTPPDPPSTPLQPP